jgi:hypothetical protein
LLISAILPQRRSVFSPKVRKIVLLVAHGVMLAQLGARLCPPSVPWRYRQGEVGPFVRVYSDRNRGEARWTSTREIAQGDSLLNRSSNGTLQLQIGCAQYFS